MEYPKITVVTVCFNCAPLLEKTICNVEQQDYPNLEYVIVDGSSKDNSLDVIKQHESSITRWVSEPDKGIYDAMNKAVGMSEGEWIIFMNAGDTFASDDVVKRAFSNSENADVIYGDVVKQGVIKKAEAPHNGHRMYFCHQSCFTRRACLMEFPYDIKHKKSADFKLYKQLFKAKKSFKQVDFPIADFDVTGVSNTQRSSGLLDNIRVIEDVDNFVDKLKLLPRLYFVYYMCKLRGK